MECAVHLQDGLVIYKRGDLFHMRLKVAPQQYVYRTLKTAVKAEAVRLANRKLIEFELKRERGELFAPPMLKRVIADYTAQRERECAAGRTSAHMLRQIKRVNKFWLEYAGDTQVDRIGNKQLSDYVLWRKAYYSKFKKLPKNARLHPKDKTLQWEVTHGKALIKWAHEQGYRGNSQLPTFFFKVEKRMVRPAFERSEYAKLYKTMRKRIYEVHHTPWVNSRLMLRDYVLILANTGLRVGELNNLKLRDIHPMTDDTGRQNYRLVVRGKTGERDVIPRASAKRWIDRAIERRKQQNAKPDDLLFVMRGGGRIITLIDQFNELLAAAGIVTNSSGKKFTLYSLRHLYAVQALRRGLSIYAVARNMGTSVQMLQQYYGWHATSVTFATALGN